MALPGYDADLFAQTSAAERTHFWYRARRDVVEAALGRFVDLGNPGAPILEIGCGNGNILALLSRHFRQDEVIGVDGFFAGLPGARAGSGRPVVQADVSALPFNGPFSVVGMFDVVEHLQNDTAALTSIRGLLGHRGRLVLTVPADPKLWSAFDVASRHFRRYTTATLQEVLERSGFEVVYLTKFMSVLYPAMRIRRARLDGGRVAADATCIRDELTIPPEWANAPLYRLLSLERHAVRYGWRLPFGTSLLAVARPAS
jgi:SAM-dependent methyltransferase